MASAIFEGPRGLVLENGFRTPLDRTVLAAFLTIRDGRSFKYRS